MRLLWLLLLPALALAETTLVGETKLTITGITSGNVEGRFIDDYRTEQELDPMPGNRIYADTSDSYDASVIPTDYRRQAEWLEDRGNPATSRYRCKSIQTQWADRGSTGATTVQFTTNVRAQVTVWHVDSVVGGRPSWITSNFADSGTDLDILGEVASGFSSVEDAGEITLGGNTTGGDTTKPMYAVSVCPAWLQAPAAIAANDGEYEFVSSTAVVSESTTPTVGSSQRVTGTDSAVSVDIYDTTTGTCTGGGSDYDAITPQTINWADAVGGVKAGFSITVNAVSANCTIILGFQNAVGGITASIGPQTHTITVNDIAAVTPTIFICYNATDCNAGAGSGWVTGSPTNDGESKATALSCPKDASDYNTESRTKLPVAGDVISIGDGTYTYDNCGNLFSNHMLDLRNQHGTADDPIVWKAENDGMVIWDGEEHNSDSGQRINPNALSGAGSRLYIITARDCSHITIQDMEMTGGEGGFWGNSSQEPCHDVIIDNMEIHDFGLAGITWQVDYWNLTISNSLLYDVVDDISKHDQNHTCVHNHSAYLNGYNLTLFNNIFHSSDGGSTLTFGGVCNFTTGAQDPPNFTHLAHVYNNTFDGNGCVLTYIEPGGDLRYNAVDFWNRATGSGGFCADIGGDPRNFKNVEFENNLFLNGQTAQWTTYDSQFISNTNAESVQPPGTTCSHWPWAAGCSTSRGVPGYLNINNNTSETRALNTEHQANTDEYLNNNDDCTDCAVANESTHNYTPFGSPTDICDQGDATNAPATDYNGTARGNPPDIGAIECP